MALQNETFLDNLNGNLYFSGQVDSNQLKNTYRILILGMKLKFWNHPLFHLCAVLFNMVPCAPKVGKTTIVNWFLDQEYSDAYIPTIEDFHRKIFKIRGEIYHMDILDTSGNDPFPAMKRLNIMVGDLFVLVFNLADVDSYFYIKTILDLVLELKTSSTTSGRYHYKKKANVPILILGNKVDLLSSANRCIDSKEIVKFKLMQKTCIFYETSCKTGEGLAMAFETFLMQSNLPIEMVPRRHRNLSLNLDLTKPIFTKFDRRNNSKSRKDDIHSQSKKIVNKAAILQSFKSKPTIKFEHESTNQNSVSSLSIDQNFSSQGSVKYRNRRSVNLTRKITFKRNGTDASAAVWRNARRPSIRAELNLLEAKSKTNHKQKKSINLNFNEHKSNCFYSLLKYLSCTKG